MVRDIPVADVDALDRAVLAIGTDYPDDHLLPWHQHRRAQVLYGATGVMRVETADGSWTVPTARAVLVPPRTAHQVRMSGVSTRSLYIEPAAVPWFPGRCRVADVSGLLRALILEAVELDTDSPGDAQPSGLGPDHGGRRAAALVELLLHELRRLVPLPLDLPLPTDPRLRRLCEAFLVDPDIHQAPAGWAAELNVSERTLGRMFHAETGLAFARWRLRACVLHAVQRLGAGEPVSRVSARLGYGSPAAFSAAFKRLLGSPPSAFAARADGRPLG